MEFCTVVGGPHFITFDKARYDFYGMCQYELVRTKRSEKSLTPMAISVGIMIDFDPFIVFDIKITFK